jgi:hypothetical protein
MSVDSHTEDPLTPGIGDLEGAFRHLVDALLEHRAWWDARPREKAFRLIPFVPIAEISSAASRGRDIVADPVSYALKRGIKMLGQIVYDLYGMRVLSDMAERVCDGPRFGERMSPVDSALNGVGKDKDRWWS